MVIFTANTLNNLLGTPMVDFERLKKLNIEPPYKYIRHLLCGTGSNARWIYHKEGGTHVSLFFAHMNWKARLREKIIYGIHMTEVTYDKVCIIYALMPTDIELSGGMIIFSSMKKIIWVVIGMVLVGY